MSKNSKIEWTDHTFNPWWGCAKVSPGCAHCYAESASKRYGHDVWGKSPRRVFGDRHWKEPLAWNAAASKAGVRARVFCASMADVFEDRLDLDIERVRLFDLITQTPHLDWLLLTKRPENVVGGMWRGGTPPPNVWMGVSVEDQQRADERIPELLKIPARVRFVSAEPLLGPVDLGLLRMETDTLIDWVIVGGESGPGARPFHLGWARSIRDECRAAGVLFFFKQAGARPHDADGLVRLRSPKGGDLDELPADLRIRETIAPG